MDSEKETWYFTTTNECSIFSLYMRDARAVNLENSILRMANNQDNFFPSPQALDTLQLLGQHGLRASNQLQGADKIGGAQQHLNEVLGLVHDSHLLQEMSHCFPPGPPPVEQEETKGWLGECAGQFLQVLPAKEK